MKTLNIIVAMILFSSCVKNTPFVIQKSNLTFKGQFDDGLLTDTFKYFKNNNLIIEQFWKGGVLFSTLYNDNGKLRNLEYVNKRDSADSTAFITYYHDKADTSFHILPYDSDILKIYDSIKVISNTKFKEGQSTSLQILNVPQNEFAMGIVGGTASLNGDKFNITPTRQAGDTLKIMFWYNSIPELETPFTTYLIE